MTRDERIILDALTEYRGYSIGVQSSREQLAKVLAERLKEDSPLCPRCSITCQMCDGKGKCIPVESAIDQEPVRKDKKIAELEEIYVDKFEEVQTNLMKVVGKLNEVIRKVNVEGKV